MRVKNEHVLFLKHSLKKYLLDADVYLIGYRANDTLKGGVLILVSLAKKHLRVRKKETLKSHFIKKLGSKK